MKQSERFKFSLCFYHFFSFMWYFWCWHLLLNFFFFKRSSFYKKNQSQWFLRWVLIEIPWMKWNWAKEKPKQNSKFKYENNQTCSLNLKVENLEHIEVEQALAANWNQWKMRTAKHLTFDSERRIETTVRLHTKSAIAINGFSVFKTYRPNLTHSDICLANHSFCCCLFFNFLLRFFCFREQICVCCKKWINALN